MFAPILSIIALVFSVYSLLVSLAVHKSTLMSAIE